MLEQKLWEIAQTIGKVDPVTGEVVEDFRLEVLGFLGTSPNYQDLYRKALVDRDYQRTEREIAEAIQQARQASEALRNLAQDLDTFNVEHYHRLRSELTLDDLRIFVEHGILQLGGAIVPEADMLRIEVPEELWSYPNVARSYEYVTFDRSLAMRRRKAQLLGLGHPLVDALIDYFQSPQVRGEVTVFPQANALSVRYLIQIDFEDGKQRRSYYEFVFGLDGTWHQAKSHGDVASLRNRLPGTPLGLSIPTDVHSQIAAALRSTEATLRAENDRAVTVRSRLVGLAGCTV